MNALKSILDSPVFNTAHGRNLLLQIIFVLAFGGVLIAAFLVLVGGGHFDFGFLDDSGNFAISASFKPFYPGFDSTSSYYEFFIVGIQNTILVSVIGVVSALILGFIVGVLRTIQNFLLQRVLDAYTELFRNTPLLLQLFALFTIAGLLLPPLREPAVIDIGLLPASYLNKTGLYFASPQFGSVLPWITIFGSIFLAIVLSYLVVRIAKRIKARTGRTFFTFPIVVAILVILPIVGFLAGTPSISYDEIEIGRFGPTGGALLPTSFLVLWFGLTVYTAAFIGENVRAGIEAVGHGQIEAAQSLGLGRWQRLRLVVIPQALRIIIPPTISQMLNLTKNSSLATVVTYPDLVAIWAVTSLNQTGAAVAIFTTTFIVYMLLSLLTSFVSNMYNKRVQIAER